MGLDKRESQRNPSDVEQLWTFFKEEFKRFSDADISMLFESLPKRINAVRLPKVAMLNINMYTVYLRINAAAFI